MAAAHSVSKKPGSVVALPAPEQLQALLETDVAHWEQSHPSQAPEGQ